MSNMAEKLDIAVRMSKSGESHAAIVRATGLMADQVNEIKQRVRA
jgi:hypothetical protein